jgi:amino acid adenylation domain-containing protein/FkbM family methyltransferase
MTRKDPGTATQRLSSVKLAALAHRARRLGGPVRDLDREPIAVTGIALRVPGAADMTEFEALVLEGKSAIGPVPRDRWNGALYDRLRDPDGRPMPPAGGFLDDIKSFDAEFFRIPGREATALDPQHRLLLELVWEALETSGQAPADLAGTSTGVWLGLSSHDYADRWIASGGRMPLTSQYGTGTQATFAPGRIAYLLGLRGPAMAIDTACSSGLVALAEATVAVRANRVERAIVGAAHLIASPGGFAYNMMVGALAPDGISKSFAQGANGFGRGEGGVVLTLERLSDAVAGNRMIWGVIRSAATGQDGASGGLTVPNGPAQSAVIRQALDDAGLCPGDIDLIEAHGTGTDLGDPIELRALAEVFAKDRGAAPLPVGSIKASIGHLEAAAGLAGLAKALVAVRAGRVPPTLHCDTPTTRVDWPGLGLRPARGGPENEKANEDKNVRLAGVSSFGMSGTNAHAIVEAPPVSPLPVMRPDWTALPLMVSARTKAALAEKLRRYSEACAALAPDDHDALVDLVAGSASVAGSAPFRAHVSVTSRTAALKTLASAAQGLGTSNAPPQKQGEVGVGFLFSGQGAALVPGVLDAALGLPSVRDRLETARQVLAPVVDRDLFDLLRAGSKVLGDTAYAQPVLAALGWSIAGWWEALGLVPRAVAGHSLGELPAAAVAGRIAPGDMLRFAAERGRLMAQCPPGAMYLAMAGEDDPRVQDVLSAHPAVEIAGRNGPAATVMAGAGPAIKQFGAALTKAGIAGQALPVSYGFHSALIDPCLAPLETLGDRLEQRRGEIAFFSTMTGAELPPDTALDGRYWRDQARQPVDFQGAVRSMEQAGITCFVDIGAVPLVAPMARRIVRSATVHAAPLDGTGALECTAAALWAAGVTLNPKGIYTPYRLNPVPQPGPVFERQTYWLEDPQMTDPVAPTPLPDNAAENATEKRSGAGDQPDTVALHLQVLEAVAEALGMPAERLSLETELIEIGADSLALVEIGRQIKMRFGVTLSARQFFGGSVTIGDIAGFIEAEISARPTVAEPASETALMPTDTAFLHPETTGIPSPNGVNTAQPSPVNAAHTSGVTSDMAQIFQQQLDLVRAVIDRQNAVLLGNGTTGQSVAPAGAMTAAPTVPQPLNTAQPPQTTAAGTDHGPFRPPRRSDSTAMTAQQAAHLNDLVTRFTARTATSKTLAAAARPHLADARASAGFRPSIKEMLYPITGARAQGARIWDVDGNEYIDISMNFGVSLMGHRHPDIEAAITDAVTSGLAMAPRSAHLAPAAEKLCRMTGMDRVVFLQSGTESVMTAVRLARLSTGRDKIALFSKSYHGHADQLLATPGFDARAPSEPVTSGIPASMVSDVIVLEYGDPSALAQVRALGTDLAAVLVEPVQSRDIINQPQAFLKELRSLTQASGSILIFDEMITGFRLAQGGAQAWYGIEADLACYGKALGGGVAIGAVAGRNGVLDGIDGGQWSYGDDSRPTRPTTFVAGTFNGNPLALAAADAALGVMERMGPDLQNSINARTAGLAQRLNTWLAGRGVDLSIVFAGSHFRFKHGGNLDLLYYHLLLRGVFVWEGRNCFLSAAHTDADIDLIEARIKEAVLALEEGGFITTSATILPDALAEPDAPVAPVASVAPAEPGAPDAPLLEPSLAQRQLWLMQARGDDAAAAYTERLAVEISGALDLEALGRAVSMLPARHQALRASMSADGQSLHIAPHAELTLTVEQADPSEDRAAWLARMSQVALDLHRAPAAQIVWRAESDTSGVLFLAAHHALFDGWSVSVVLSDLLGLLSDPTRAPVAAQMGDVLEDMRQRRDAGGQKLAAFWQGQLAGLSRPALPVDRSDGPPVVHLRRRLDPSLRETVKTFARSCKATPFAAFLGLTAATLHRWAGGDALAIGCPVLGRGEDPDLMQAAAYATHLLPVVADLSADQTLRAAVTQMRDRLLDALDHQDLPFSEMIERFAPRDRSGASDQLISVTFNLDRPELPEAPPGLVLGLADVAPTAAKFPLCINLLDLGEAGMVLDVDADGRRFSESAIAALMDRLIASFGSCDAFGDRPLGDLPLADKLGQRQVEAFSNGPVADWSAKGTIPAQIDAACARFADHTAIAADDGAWSYAQLRGRTATLAAQLQSAGVTPGDRIAIVTERSGLLPAMLVAVLRAGGVFVPISPDDPIERIVQMIADSGARLCLVEDGSDAATNLAGVGAACPLHPVSIAGLDDSPDAEFEAPDLPADAPAYLLYTSGSTGTPKGVLCRHDGLTNRIAWMDDMMGIAPGDTVLQKTPYTFDVSVWEFLWPLTCGATLAMAAPGLHKDPAALADCIVAHGITHVHFVPSMLALFLATPKVDACKTLKVLVTSGEALLPAHVAAFQASGLGARFWNLYGPTEASIDVTAHEITPGGPPLPMVPIGTPVANTTVRVLTDDRQPCLVGDVGEIWLGGVQLAQGYLDRADLTQAAFVENAMRPGERLYRTGDLGRWLADGSLAYLGRADGQIKLAGQRMELTEIEAHLNALPTIRDSAVTVLGADETRHLAAFVVAQAGPHSGLPILPDGGALAVLNAAEAAFLVEENWIDQVYFQHGVGLSDGAVVLDIGANIGVFATAVTTGLPNARVIAVEPSPATTDVLRQNAARLDGRITVVEAAAGAKNGTATLLARDRLSLLSSIKGTQGADIEMVKDFVNASGDAQARDGAETEMLEHLLQTKAIEVPVVTVSDLIRRHGLSHIDLLKIDVEGAENAVFEGIAPEDWALIQQVAVEVHDIEGRAARMSDVLRSHGFDVTAAPVGWSRHTPLVMLYARSPRTPPRGPLPLSVPAAVMPVLEADQIIAQLSQSLPQAMVPRRIFSLGRLPLGRHGKLDRKSLAALVPQTEGTGAERRAPQGPQTETETLVIAEMADLLGVAISDRAANFFHLGGQSLQAARLVQGLRQKTGSNLPIGSIFDAPTPAGLAQVLDRLARDPSAGQTPGHGPNQGPTRADRASRRAALDSLESAP